MTTADALDAARPGAPRSAIDPGLALWLVAGLVAVACFALRAELPWLVAYPEALTLPVADWINLVMAWLVENVRWLFKALSWLLGWPMAWLQGLLHWLPWPATIFGFAVLAHLAGGWRLAAFTVVALLYMVVVGYWDESMSTLALVGVSVPLAIGLGFGLGLLAYKSDRAERIIAPTLDLMQTVPTFAYLIPILLLFGFGPVVGLIASAIYACPPMVRNVMLGLRRVPREIVESAQMSGTTKRQQLWWVEVPTALPTVMIGVNQTTMAALSMVIIAAIIGGFEDIGWEVLSTMRKAQFGQSLLAGAVIALIAMLMDRISLGFTDRERFLHLPSETLWQRHRYLFIALGGMALATLFAQLVPALRDYPAELVVYPADALNSALLYVITTYDSLLDALKKTTLFYFLLPARIGLEGAVRPMSWGFEMTLPIALGYGVAVAALALWAGRFWRWPAGVAVALLGGLFFFGVTRTPWPVFMLAVCLIAWQVGGRRVALFALLGMLFLLLTGIWSRAMLSVYLCGAAVALAFVLGGALGIWASRNDHVSAFLRPINDTLQTMPLFVFLIPIIMFFQTGEFSALLAILAYAIVPAIRYTEHGLRNVRPDLIEAAEGIGCTKRQLLWQVKLPLALPEIMLGLNQTIMYGLAMLVIAALVGTKGLGQLVYIALGQADAGVGIVAGLGMAIIAMVADRIIQAWSAQRKAALGLA